MSLNNLGLGMVLTARDMASGVMGRVRESFGRMGDASDDAQARFSAGISSFSRGAALIGAGALALRASWGMASEATKLEQAVAEVTTLVDDAAISIENLTAISEEMAGTYGGDAIMQAKAMYQTISAGITDATKATDLLRVANELAVGGVTDVTTAVDGLTTMVNAFATQGAEARDVSDAMFVAIRAGKTDATQLGASLGRVAPTAAALGIRFDELLASIAAVTTQGIATSEAASGLKAAMANIIRPTSDAEAEAKRLGIQFDAAALRAQGLAGFLNSITSAAGFNEDSISKLFGSVEAFNVMQAITTNNSAKLTEVLGQMAGRTGATSAAFGRMAGTGAFQNQQLIAQWENTKRLLGRAVLPAFLNVMEKIATAIEGVVNAFHSMPAEVQKVIGLSLVWGGVLTVLAGGLMMLKGLLIMVGVLAGITLLPIIKVVAIVTAVGMAAYMIWKHWDKVGKYIKAAIILAFGPLLSAPVLIISNWGKVVDWFSSLPDRVGSALSGTVDAVRSWVGSIRDAWDGGVDSMLLLLKEFAFVSVPSILYEAAMAVGDFIKAIPGIGTIAELGGEAVGGVQSLLGYEPTRFATPEEFRRERQEAVFGAAVPATAYRTIEATHPSGPGRGTRPSEAGATERGALSFLSQPQTIAAQGVGAIVAALRETRPTTPPAPISPVPQDRPIHTAVTLNLDGETVARVLARTQRNELARGFQQQPVPEG